MENNFIEDFCRRHLRQFCDTEEELNMLVEEIRKPKDALLKHDNEILLHDDNDGEALDYAD